MDEDVKRLLAEISDGNFEKVQALLCSQKIDLEQGDENGLSPLLMAAHKGHYEIAKLLLDHGADVNYRNHNHKYSALMFAAIGGRKK